MFASTFWTIFSSKTPDCQRLFSSEAVGAFVRLCLYKYVQVLTNRSNVCPVLHGFLAV